MNLVDAVMFFDEVDLLRVRCSEHYEHVSKIFVIEAELTHSYLPRTQTFLDHRSKFVEWQDKIEHIVVPASAFQPAASPASQKAAYWNEEVQHLWPYHHNMAPSADWWLRCGADEIVRSSEFSGLKDFLGSLVMSKSLLNNRTVRLNFDFYNFALNLQLDRLWTQKRMFYSPTSRRTRLRFEGVIYPPTIGWHFSYLGGPEVVQKKLQALVHFREDHVARVIGKPERIQQAIRDKVCMFGGGTRLIEVVTKNHLPQYMLDNWEEYEKYWYYGEE